ncbi:MAG: hypothetical protein HYU53_12680 [Acidobacteria bacterium]|nr:hypothetical protein [Acidobacteriota bacterium]
MFSSRSDEWTVARWRQPNIAQVSLDFIEPNDGLDEEGRTPLWKDLTVASGLALALWAIAAIIFLG